MSAARCERAQRTISTSSLASAGSTTAAGAPPSTAKRWQEAASVATRPAVTERSDSSLSVATVMVGKKAERHGRKKKDSPRRHRGTEEKQVPRLRPAHSLSWWHRPLACGECKTPARRRGPQNQAGRGSARDDRGVWERTGARSGPGSLGERPGATATPRLRPG